MGQQVGRVEAELVCVGTEAGWASSGKQEPCPSAPTLVIRACRQLDAMLGSSTPCPAGRGRVYRHAVGAQGEGSVWGVSML